MVRRPRVSLTVITATIPGREFLLAEATNSVNWQTLPVDKHLVRCEEPYGVGEVHLATQRNALLTMVETEWTAVLDDDNLWLARHHATIAEGLTVADVIYTWDTSTTRPRVDCNGWTQDRIIATLDAGNFIDANAAIRTSALRAAGGWPTDWEGPRRAEGGHFANSPASSEDWELWRRLARAGARFLCLPVETWTYGMGEWRRASEDAEAVGV
jgi:hypothetical protein